MPIKVYLYKNCSTCKKSKNFLDSKKISYALIEINLNPPPIEELRLMLKYLNGNIKKLFNASGLLYKELNLKEKLANMPDEEAITLLSSNGMLVKRPFLLSDHCGLVGFKEKEWLDFFQNSFCLKPK